MSSAEAWEVFCEKIKMVFGNLKRIKKKTYEKKIIQDFAMWFEIIISKFIKKICNGVEATIPDSHANGPSSIPSVGIPI